MSDVAKYLTNKEFDTLVKNRLDIPMDIKKFSETEEGDVVAFYSGKKVEEFDEDFLDWHDDTIESLEGLQISWVISALVTLGDIPEKTAISISITEEEKDDDEE